MMLQFVAYKFALYLIISVQTDLLALLALLHFSGDCSRPQGKGYEFWYAHCKASSASLAWLMEDADCWNLVFKHYYTS